MERETGNKELLKELPKMSRWELLDVLGDRVAFMPRERLERFAAAALLVVPEIPPLEP